jgi:hypothetical protein
MDRAREAAVSYYAEYTMYRGDLRVVLDHPSARRELDSESIAHCDHWLRDQRWMDMEAQRIASLGRARKRVLLQRLKQTHGRGDGPAMPAIGEIR